MSNTTASDWDETSPALNQPRRAGATEITALRKAVRARIAKEHESLATADEGGEHLKGSAKCYFQASAPTQRPDATTNLDTDDAGRIWIDSDTLLVSIWDGNSWEAPVPDLEAYSDNAPISLPYNKTGLAPGVWFVIVQLLKPAIPSPSSGFDIDITINGTLLRVTVPTNTSGTTVTELMGLVTVTGAGTMISSAHTNINSVLHVHAFRVGS